MRYGMSILAVIGLFAMTGCESLRGVTGSLGGIFGIAQNKIEAALAAEVAGTYVVEIKKDGVALLTESWECTKGADGKLTGCHKK